MNNNFENENNGLQNPPPQNPQNEPQPTIDFPIVQNSGDGFDGYSDYDPSLEMRQRQQGPFTREQLKHNLRSSGFDESSVNHFDDTVVGNYHIQNQPTQTGGQLPTPPVPPQFQPQQQPQQQPTATPLVEQQAGALNPGVAAPQQQRAPGKRGLVPPKNQGQRPSGQPPMQRPGQVPPQRPPMGSGAPTQLNQQNPANVSKTTNPLQTPGQRPQPTPQPTPQQKSPMQPVQQPASPIGAAEEASSPDISDMFASAQPPQTPSVEVSAQTEVKDVAQQAEPEIYGHEGEGGPTLTEQIQKVKTVPLRGFGDMDEEDKKPKATKGTVSRKGVSSKEVDKQNEKQGLLEKQLDKESTRSRNTLDRDDEDEIEWVETKKGKRKNKKDKAKKAKIKGFDDDDFDVKRSSRGAKSAVVMLSVVCLLLLGAIVVLYLDFARTVNEKDLEISNAYLQTSPDTTAPGEAYPTEPYATVSDMIATSHDVNSLTEFMQRYNPDSIVYTDTDLRELVYVPVDPNLPKSEWDYSYLTAEDPDNMSRAYIDPTTGFTGIMGIDVSEYQGDIEWDKVAENGVEYAIIKVGARGYETGDLIDDPKFEENVEGAIDAGIHVGVYFFSTATTVEESIEEAKYTIEKLGDYDIKYPVVIDIEELSARKPEMTIAERTDNVIAFCEEVKAAGYIPMIYSGQQFFIRYLDLSRLLDYDLWFAQYFVNRPFFPYRHTMWQYTASGVIPGITENTVDLNIGFFDYSTIVTGP